MSELLKQLESVAAVRATQSAMPQPIAAHLPLPPAPFENPLITNLEANLASEFCRRLADWIADFDAKLDNDHEVGVRLISFGQSVTFHLEGLGCWNPSLIQFAGRTEDGNPVELIQHVSQISLLLMRLPRLDPSKPKREIGFHVADTPEDAS